MKKEEELRDETMLAIARQMLIAARTAPKAKGKDNLELILCDKEDLQKIAQRMFEMVDSGRAAAFFKRDGENLLQAQAMLLMGCRIRPCNLSPCGMCGFENCGKKPESVPCALNTTDLGIALGSAAGRAADMRADSRIMYSAGQAAKELGYFSEDIRVFYALPISAGGKSPFFDRKPN